MSRFFSTPKIVLFIIVCLFSVSDAFAQCRELAEKQKAKAVKEFNGGRYLEAKKLFEAAKGCPEWSAIDKSNLTDWIKRCDANIAHRTSNTKGSSKYVSPSKGEVEFTHLSCTTQCNDQGGIQLKLCFQVKGMKGKRIGVRCILFPERGRPMPRKDSDQSGEYSVFGGKLGIEKEYSISSDDEYFSETYFFPFSVMDFGGDYVTQALGVDFHVFEPCKNEDLENMNSIKGGVLEDKFSISPVAFTLNGSTKNISIPVDYDGGVYSPKIATCGCDIQWGGDIPNWITIDKNGIDVHVSENYSSQKREATLRIESDAGWGNVITVKIKQKGR